MRKVVMADYTSPECLRTPHVGAWYIPDLIPLQLSEEVQLEVTSSGLVEPIRPQSGTTNQIFERLIIDLTKEHDFPRVAELGALIGSTVIEGSVELFPAITDLCLDEAAVQIYPAGAKLPLGWHHDNHYDGLVVISATLTGEGAVSFTNRHTFKDMQPSDVTAKIEAKALSALVLRANGLYQPKYGSDVRVGHAVTEIGTEVDRFTIQYRKGVNAGDYGNTPINSDRPYVGGIRFD